MAGASVPITVTIDDAEVRAAFQRLVTRVADRRPFLAQIGETLVSSTIHRFENERGPDGQAWKKSTRARRDKGQTLSDSGRLRSSITYFSDNDQVDVGTNVQYAAPHQFGAEVGPFVIRPKFAKALYWPGASHPVAKVNHPGFKIPARPFLGMDAQDRVSVLRIVRRAIQAAGAGTA